MKKTRKWVLGLLTAYVASASGVAVAANCPFEQGSLTREGLVITRYALGMTGATLVAGTDLPADSASLTTIASNLACVDCGLDLNGNGAVDPVDAAIISRKLAGFGGNALYQGLNLAGGSVTTPATRATGAAIDSFLLAGCGSPSNAWILGGNAYGVTATDAVLGTTDAKNLKVQSGGTRVSLVVPGNDGLKVVQTTGVFSNAPNLINGSSANRIPLLQAGSAAATTQGATVAGGGRFGADCFDRETLLFERYCGNEAANNYATVSGGLANRASGDASAVGGGQSNTVGGYGSAIGGGRDNVVSSDFGTIAGGDYNAADGDLSSIAGGTLNYASGVMSTISGGRNNRARGRLSMIAGGDSNIASGNYSFAAGQSATAASRGQFVWADSRAFPFNPSVSQTGYGLALDPIDSFNVRATGGFYFVTGINVSGIPTAGVGVLSGSGTWTSFSDRNGKKDISPVNAKEILRKVVEMPVSTWQYLNEHGVRHIGPMAQDFKRLFSVGANDTSIAVVDADGVAIAAIQGLHQIVNEKNAEIATLKRRLAAIERKLGAR
jgi:Chaperone of endosialidase/Ubiquitous surface protein adhesin repeat